MAIPDVTTKNLGYFEERLNAIKSDSQRQWGQLTPAGLMRHLCVSVELSMGEGPDVKTRSIPVIGTIMRVLFFHVFTKWPHGKIKVPDEVTPEADHSLDEERGLLLETLKRFVAESEKNPGRKVPSMAFGRLTLAYYRHLHGVHFQHHFRQFGVV